MTDGWRTAIAVAAHGLDGSRTELPSSPLDDDTWSALMAHIRHERLAGLLGAAISDGLPVTARQADEAARLQLESAGEALLLERVLVQVSDALAARSIEHRVLKGPALAHTIYPEPSLRSFGDIDILVPGDRFDEAVAALVERGGRRRYPEPRPGFVSRFGKGVAIERPDGFEVDLHRTFVSGRYGLTIGLSDLFETSTPFSVGGRTLLGLGPEARFLHACYAAVLSRSPPRLRSLRDVVQILLVSDPDLDVDRVRRMSRAWRADAVVTTAVRTAFDTFELADVTPLSVWAGSFEPGRRERKALGAYVGVEERYARQAVTAVSVIPGLPAKLAYLRALVFPDRSYLQARDRGYRARWRRGASLVRTAGRR